MMTKSTPKLIFFGNEQLAQGIKARTPIFDALIAHGYQICAVILPTAHTRKPFPIDLVAKSAHIPVYYTKDSTEILKIIQQTHATLGILAAYSKFIPDSIIQAFPRGIINIHPSLLPNYRGTTPIETALLNNDRTAGVSIMRLVKAMDAGPTLAQDSFHITSDTTKQALYEQLSTKGAKLLLQILPRVLDGTAVEKTQDETKATFTTPLTKDLSLLRPDTKSASRLVREIIAYAGFPKSKIQLLNRNCIITAAHSASTPQTQLDLRCVDDNYLVIDRLIPENSKEMDATSFLNGIQHAN